MRAARKRVIVETLAVASPNEGQWSRADDDTGPHRDLDLARMTAAVVYAKSLDLMVRFYTTLGLDVDEAKHGDYAVLTGRELELSIVQIPPQIAAQIDISAPPRAREGTPIKLSFAVPSIDDALEATRALGGRIKEGSSRWQFRGHTVQDAIDPEGNVYQLREPL